MLYFSAHKFEAMIIMLMCKIFVLACYNIYKLDCFSRVHFSNYDCSIRAYVVIFPVLQNLSILSYNFFDIIILHMYTSCC